MYGAIGFYDWMIPANREVGILQPTFSVADSSVGGTAIGSLATLGQELMTDTYARNGMDRSGGGVFQIDIQTNASVLGETQVTYGAIAAVGVKVRANGSSTYIAAKVTITVDANSGSFGGGAVYSQVVQLGAADPKGRATYPNRSAVVFPWASGMTEQTRRNGGMGGTGRNKIRIKIEPVVGTGGSTGVVVYDVLLTRIMLPRCFFCRVGNGSLVDGVVDESDVQRSYSGHPYINKRPPLRRASGVFVDLTKPYVYGNDASTEVDSSLRAVNGFAGRSSNVIFSPRLAPPADELSSGAYLASWSNEHIVGLLENPLTAQLQTALPDSDAKMLWQASFGILETPVP